VTVPCLQKFVAIYHPLPVNRKRFNREGAKYAKNFFDFQKDSPENQKIRSCRNNALFLQQNEVLPEGLIGLSNRSFRFDKKKISWRSLRLERSGR
jgi:hypothetical protein